MLFRFNSEDGDILDVTIDRQSNTAGIIVAAENGFHPNFGIDELKAVAALLTSVASVMEQLEKE